jgi:hypothetical protein
MIYYGTIKTTHAFISPQVNDFNLMTGNLSKLSKLMGREKIEKIWQGKRNRFLGEMGNNIFCYFSPKSVDMQSFFFI